ncbi:hypothetical protein NMG60_11017875 [Bertholletia excelsa]
MNWLKGVRFLTKYSEGAGEGCKFGASLYSRVNQRGLFDAKSISSLGSQGNGRGTSSSVQQLCSGSKDVDLQKNLIITRNMVGKFQVTHWIKGDAFDLKSYAMNMWRRYGQSTGNDHKLDRDFLAQLWVADQKMQQSKAKRRKAVNNAKHGKAYIKQNKFPFPVGRASVTDAEFDDGGRPVLRQPPLSQSITGLLESASPEEVSVAPLLARSTLLITRDIEWANLVFGFEQENRYAIIDVSYPQSPVGFIREQSNIIARQLLRLRRPFVAYITDALGNELFRVRRPFWWITSSIYTEIDGKEVGVVHRRWHLWRRIYDLYLGDKQFAMVENPGFWDWTFTMKDIDGKVLAQIDRDWRGFGFEIFTDAGQYVIRFGSADTSPFSGSTGVVEDLEVARPLTLSERAVAVALALSLDNDYFSRRRGWGLPFFISDE